MIRGVRGLRKAVFAAIASAASGVALWIPGALFAGEYAPDPPADSFLTDGDPPGFLLAEAGHGPGAEGAPPPEAGEVPPERLERWRSMSPGERDRIRERYRRWKELPPEERERILERRRRWENLPREEREYLKERRALLREAGPQQRRVVRRFFARMRSLPPPARRMARGKILEWRSLPPHEREEAMLSWPFYRDLSERERDTLRWFLFGRPGDRPPGGGPFPRRAPPRD